MIRSCAACGQQNRVPADHLHQNGRCGACKAPLPASAKPIDADEALFDEIVGQAKVPVLVDFWAAWCGPCRRAAPEVERAAADRAGRALVLKVDTDAHPRLAARFGVSGIPHFAVLKQGKVAFSQAGLVRASDLVSFIDRAA